MRGRGEEQEEEQKEDSHWLTAGEGEGRVEKRGRALVS